MAAETGSGAADGGIVVGEAVVMATAPSRYPLPPASPATRYADRSGGSTPHHAVVKPSDKMKNRALSTACPKSLNDIGAVDEQLPLKESLGP